MVVVIVHLKKKEEEIINDKINKIKEENPNISDEELSIEREKAIEELEIKKRKLN